MRWALLGVRLALLAPLALVLVALLARSSLLSLVAQPTPLVLLAAAAAIGVGLLPALLARASPLPGALAAIVPVAALAAYDQSRLDWLRVLKDYGVASPDTPDPLRLGLAATALLLAWVAHVLDGSLRLRHDARARGLTDGEAKAAAARVRAAGTRLGGLALVGTIGVGGLALLAGRLDAAALLGGRASLVAPLLAVGLVALAAALLWSDRARLNG